MLLIRQRHSRNRWSLLHGPFWLLRTPTDSQQPSICLSIGSHPPSWTDWTTLSSRSCFSWKDEYLNRCMSTLLLFDGLIEPRWSSYKFISWQLFQRAIMSKIEGVLLELIIIWNCIPTKHYKCENFNQVDIGSVLIVQQLCKVFSLHNRDSFPTHRQQFSQLRISLYHGILTTNLFNKIVSLFVEIIWPSACSLKSLKISLILVRVKWF